MKDPSQPTRSPSSSSKALDSFPVKKGWSTSTGQIMATSHDLGPQEVAEEGNSPYFREI